MKHDYCSVFMIIIQRRKSKEKRLDGWPTYGEHWCGPFRWGLHRASRCPPYVGNIKPFRSGFSPQAGDANITYYLEVFRVVPFSSHLSARIMSVQNRVPRRRRGGNGLPRLPAVAVLLTNSEGAHLVQRNTAVPRQVRDGNADRCRGRAAGRGEGGLCMCVCVLKGLSIEKKT